jgi:hypothetical protein
MLENQSKIEETDAVPPPEEELYQNRRRIDLRDSINSPNNSLLKAESNLESMDKY